MRFGWTPDQCAALTPAQWALLRKEDERRTVEVTTLVRDAVANAVANVRRKKGKRPLPLWKRKGKATGRRRMSRKDALGKMAAIERRGR